MMDYDCSGNTLLCSSDVILFKDISYNFTHIFVSKIKFDAFKVFSSSVGFRSIEKVLIFKTKSSGVLR